MTPNISAYFKTAIMGSMNGPTFRSIFILLALAIAQECNASILGGDDVCYFGLVQGDACSISIDDKQLDAVTNRNMTDTGNQKNISCLANEISSVIRFDVENLKPRPDSTKSNRLGAKRRPTRQSDEEVQMFHVGDVVDFMTLEYDPGPAADVYYPCVIRGVQHEVGDDGSVLLKYRVERLMDGFHAWALQDNLKPYEKYEYGASNNVMCRKRSIDGTVSQSFEDCQVVGDNFPDWIIDHRDPHTRAESFLNGGYMIIYTKNLRQSRDLREVHRIPAHDMFSFRIHVPSHV